MKSGLLLILFIIPLLSVASTIKVCKSCKVSSITVAVDLAKDGDSIIVAKGIYKEHNIIIRKSLSLIGVDNPIIDG